MPPGGWDPIRKQHGSLIRLDRTAVLFLSGFPQRLSHVGAKRLPSVRVIDEVKQMCIRDSSCRDPELRARPELAVDSLVAPPQMARYMAISAQIYDVYLKYIAPEDIHSYSIDEVFLDVTCYLKTYGLTPRELAMRMILDVLHTTGITATAGIGPNPVSYTHLDVYTRQGFSRSFRKGKRRRKTHSCIMSGWKI